MTEQPKGIMSMIKRAAPPSSTVEVLRSSAEDGIRALSTLVDERNTAQAENETLKRRVFELATKLEHLEKQNATLQFQRDYFMQRNARVVSMFQSIHSISNNILNEMQKATPASPSEQAVAIAERFKPDGEQHET